MSGRWRERKGGSFVSAAELAARKKALLAPVSKWKKAWVQPSPHSSYKVLKWVPRHAASGDAAGAQIIHPHDDPYAIDDSDDDDNLSDDDAAPDAANAVGAVGGLVAGEAKTKETREARLERKTNKAVAAAERGGAQLAGLETGETAEEVNAKSKRSGAHHAGGSTSGTATPAEPASSSSAFGISSALGGLDGGSAARADKGRPTSGSSSALASGTVSPTPIPTPNPASAVPPGLMTSAPADPSPLRRASNADALTEDGTTAEPSPAPPLTARGASPVEAPEPPIEDDAMAIDAPDERQELELDVAPVSSEVAMDSDPVPAVPTGNEAEPRTADATLLEDTQTERIDVPTAIPTSGPAGPPSLLAEPLGEARTGPAVEPGATEASALIVGPDAGGVDALSGTMQQELAPDPPRDEEEGQDNGPGLGIGSVS